jgi:phosphatidylglycerophosphatase C
MTMRGVVTTARPDGVTGPSGPVVVFDFDGVLVRGDSYRHFILRELNRSRRRLALMLPVLVVAMPMLKTAALRPHGQRLMLRFTFLGWSRSRFEANALEFGRQLANDETLVIGEAVDVLRRHVADGARVLVATRSAAVVVRAVLDEWGLQTVDLVASSASFSRLGMTSSLGVGGAAKVRELAKLGVRPPWDVAYSDSLSDFPLLAGAEHPVLVNGDQALRAKARNSLGPRLSFVAWR